MSSTLRNGETRDLNLTASDYITLVAVSGTYTATVVRGNSSGTVLGTNVTGGTYGPYTGGAVIRVVTSASSEVDFDIGASPVIVSDTFVTASTNPVTGRISLSAGGSFVYGRNLQYPMRYWQRAVARVKAGKANATIACIGDSITAGSMADGVNPWTANKPLSYPSALASVLSGSYGISTCTGSVISDNSTTPHAGTVPQYDPRVTFGANWGASGAASTAGGQMIYSVSSALGTLAAETFTFTPIASFDTVEVFWFRNTTTSTFTIDCGGAVLATCAGGSPSVQKTVVTKTAGIGPINIIRTVAAGSVAAIVGINTYLSTTKTANVLNMGASAATTTVWNSVAGVYAPLNVLPQYAPDLSVICLGINDAILNASTATIIANLSAIITVAQTTGDVVLVVPNAVDTSITSTINQANMQSAIYQVSATYGINVVDINQRWSGYTTSNTLGYMSSDKTHPVQIGYQDIANIVAACVCNT